MARAGNGNVAESAKALAQASVKAKIAGRRTNCGRLSGNDTALRLDISGCNGS